MTVLHPLPPLLPSGARRIEHLEALSAATCLSLVERLGGSVSRQSQIMDAYSSSGARVDRAIRSSDLFPFDLDSKVGRDLVELCSAANDEMFHLDVIGILANDTPAIHRYRNESYDHFARHVDVGDQMPYRKLTFTVQLTPEDAYVGGDLVFPEAGVVAPRTVGSMTIFSSLLAHVVTPIVSGVRHALVGWIHGNEFC